MFPKLFSYLRQLLREQRLDEALATAVGLTDKYPALAQYKGVLQNLSLEHHLMCQTLLNGYEDKQRNVLYSKSIGKLYRISANMMMQWLKVYNSVVAPHVASMRGYVFDLASVRERLESYVAQKALHNLDSGSVYKSNEAEMTAEHYKYHAALFRHLWLSEQWNKDYAEEFADVMASATVDAEDVQLIVSAIMLSVLTVFDEWKLHTLIYIYVHSQDEKVRQRALVGVAFALTRKEAVCQSDDVTTLLQTLLDDDIAAQQLVETQMQMFYCLNAEEDNAEIQREIIPTLLKNSPIVMQDGKLIERAEEDELNDILHPHAEEEAAEEVEASMRRMMDMQKSGADIFFGGFSQMKRFPFFHDLVNWFMPFSLHHPALEGMASKGERVVKLLKMMLDRGPFCDSDKYSFTLVMEQTIDKMPPNIMEAIGAADGDMEELHAREYDNPSYIRRAYLQDLYRFFRLQRDRELFSTPFSSSEHSNSPLFLAHPLLCHAETISRRAEAMASFLYRRKQWMRLREWCEAYSYTHTPHIDLFHALALQQSGRMTESGQILRGVLQAEPDNRRAMSALARCYFADARYADALPLYAQLHQAKPESRAYAMRYIVCLVETEMSQMEESEAVEEHDARLQEALKEAYALQYNNPEDDDANRILGWTLLMTGRAAKAAVTFSALSEADAPQADDVLHYAYCLWFSGERRKALQWLNKYAEIKEKINAQERRNALHEAFRWDRRLFAQYAVDDIEQQLTLDLAVHD